MLLQVNDQSLRLLDVESQVRQQQRADLPSCRVEAVTQTPWAALWDQGTGRGQRAGRAGWGQESRGAASHRAMATAVLRPGLAVRSLPGGVCAANATSQAYKSAGVHVLRLLLGSICARGCEPVSQPPVPQEELENFPLPTVRHSQTVLNQLRYPSVLLLVCQDSDQSKPDVHFFHCDQVEVRRAAVLWARVPRSQSQPDTPAPPRQSWCTRTLRARWPTAGWERRCGRRP